MSTTLRTWLAGLALGFSALVLLLTAQAPSLATTLPVALLVVFAHGWLIAVGERAGARKGGVEFQRFGIGPRLLEARPSVFPQCLAMVVVLGAVSGNWVLVAIGFAGLLCGFADLVRATLPILLPIAGVIAGLLTMDEFHTLGDLLVTAKSWVESALLFAVTALVVCGPLMRSDAAAPSGRLGPFVYGLTAVPAYLGSLWLACFSPWSGWQPDVMNIVVALLVGGLLQTILVGLILRGPEHATRRPETLPPVAASNVGLGLVPLLLPVLFAAATRYLPTGGELAGQVPDDAWAALVGVALIVPGILAAGLVAARLDRLDGRWTSRVPELVPIALFAGWFVFGPQMLLDAAGPSGWSAGLRDVFQVLGSDGSLAAGANSAAQWPLGLGGDGVDLWRLPAADILRTATLLCAGCALLSVRLLTHAREELRGPGLALMAALFGLSIAVASFLVPLFGAPGAMLAPLPVLLGAFLFDSVRGTRELPAVVEDRNYDGFLVGEMEAPENARSIPDLDDDDLGSALSMGESTFPEHAAPVFDDGWEPGQRFTPGEVETEADARAAGEPAAESPPEPSVDLFEEDDEELGISL